MTPKKAAAKKEKHLIGWREVVALPDFDLYEIKAKIDTGAKTSALHAQNIQYFVEKGKTYVQFDFFDEKENKVSVKSKLLEERKIKSSNGHITIRPVVETKIKMGPVQFKIELTLINRDLMDFKMLIGREALKNFFIINPARSFLLKKED